MAARRVTKLNVDWAALAERIPAEHKPNFNALKSRTESNLGKMLALPEKPPVIDWTFYKSKIPKPALVDSFQKKYETLQVPFPVDTVTAQINEHQKEIDKLILEDLAASNALIKDCEQRLAVLKDQLPIINMTIQEYAEAYPEDVVDALHDPTPWPHDPEEIKEYKAELAALKEGKAPPSSATPATH